MKRKHEFDEWVEELKSFHLPRWEELSDVSLYMEQLIQVVEKQLSIFGIGPGEKLTITASMVNNYVKLGLMPKPIKKRYNRRHIAYLVIITLYKQIISIHEVREALKYLASAHGSSSKAYNQFCDLLEQAMQRSVNKYLGGKFQDDQTASYAKDDHFDSFLIWTACETIINLFFAKKIITLIELEDQANASSFEVPKDGGN